MAVGIEILSLHSLYHQSFHIRRNKLNLFLYQNREVPLGVLTFLETIGHLNQEKQYIRLWRQEYPDSWRLLAHIILIYI